MEEINAKKKQDVAAKVQNVANEFMRFIDDEFPESYGRFADDIEKKVTELLDQVDKPKVMVYGMYNSGKSTLINALCREAVAEVGNRPKTYNIAEYDKGDYWLVDSPGVDAPIQHQMVTEEHLDKCHVILFVISSKGMFEDQKNYVYLANLIQRDTPFVIVLNEKFDEDYKIKKEWTDEQKKEKKKERVQELIDVQHKIIENLIKESNDPKIAEQYEVIVLNAREAWMGVEKQKELLYEASGVKNLDKRIIQLISDDAKTVCRQPIANLKNCLDEVEKIITQKALGNHSEDFAARLSALETKRNNILDDLRILTQYTVNSHLDELTNSYFYGDSDLFETTANTIFIEIDEKYSDRLKELLGFAADKFKEQNLDLDSTSNLRFDFNGAIGGRISSGTQESGENSYDYANESCRAEKTKWYDFLKSRKKREKEKRERLELEAEVRNRREQYKLNENIRKKQEARQAASSDLADLNQEFQAIVSDGLTEKYNDIIRQIQQIESQNQQERENGERQMNRVRELRGEISEIENTLSWNK